MSDDYVYTLESVVSAGDVVGEIRESMRTELREQLLAKWHDQNPGKPEPTAYDRLSFSLDVRDFNEVIQAVAFACAQRLLALPSKQSDRERELGELADRTRAQLEQARHRIEEADGMLTDYAAEIDALTHKLRILEDR